MVASKANPRRLRSATYCVQLQADFTFDDAATIAHYLSALSVSHVSAIRKRMLASSSGSP
jgi:maltooligosyltrehalose synthase